MTMVRCNYVKSLLLWLRFKEDRNMMAMAGKGVQHSAGYREAPPEEDL